MINCPKCNSKNITKAGPFARKNADGQKTQTLSDQMVNYHCEGCNNDWQVKFGEDST